MSRFKLLFVLFVCIFSVMALGQPNTVQLKDGTGTLISSYPSITAAYNAIPAAINQAYVIEMLPEYTSENEVVPIQITYKTGSSALNTITLRPASNNSGEVITRPLNNNPIINIDGAQYFILDGRPGGVGDTSDLVIENSLNNGAKTNTINLVSGASNNVIRFVYAKSIPRSNAGPRNIYIQSDNFGNTSNNLIEDCKILGGRAGVSFEGLASGLSSNNTIRRCEIFSFGLVGVWLITSAENTTIQECKIYQKETGLNTSFVGGIILNPDATRGTTNIIANNIYGMKHGSILDTAAAWGIKGSASTGSTLNIINNFVSLPANNQFTSNTHGILINDTTRITCNLIYNSVRIGGTQAGSTLTGGVLSSAFTKVNNNSNSVFNLLNNIFVNKRSGGLGYHVAEYVQSTDGTISTDFNCYHSTVSIYQVIWGNIPFDSLYVYRTAVYPNEQNSIFKDVAFASEVDLHISTTSIGDPDLIALPCYVTNDIDNDIRVWDTPYKGADEAEGLPVEMGSFTSSVSGSNVVLSWTTKTEKNNAGFEIQRKSTTEGWTVIGHVSGTGTSTLENSYNFTDKNLAAGKYSYRIKQTDFGGSYTFYALSGEVEIASPAVYSLSQNYPNPFNPSTTIEYTIPEDGLVNISIYSLTGELVKTLVNSDVKSGRHNVTFDASSLSSGTYFYTVRANNFTATKKMILLR